MTTRPGCSAAAMLVAGAAAWAWRRRAREAERLFAETRRRLEQLQREFERFAPPDLVERLTAGQGDVAPQRRQVTMLFADLRGFTALCDRLDPAVTVTILNDYFRHMSLAIGRHHGHITELVGDGLLALFGALEANPWQCRDAVLAALDMRAALAGYNAQLRAQSLPELRFGIGIHSGEVIVGVMGAGRAQQVHRDRRPDQRRLARRRPDARPRRGPAGHGGGPRDAGRGLSPAAHGADARQGQARADSDLSCRIP